MRLAVVILCFVALSAALTGAQGETLIVPGRSVAGIALGMSANEAIAASTTAFGGFPDAAQDCTTPADKEAGVKCSYRRWREGEATLSVLMLRGRPGEERVFMASTRRAGPRTAEGIGVGVTFSEAVRVYGAPQTGPRIPVGYGQSVRAALPTTEAVAWWPARGLGVIYTSPSGPIVAVVVFVQE